MPPGNYTCEVEWAGDPIRVTHSLVVLQPPTINKPLIGEKIYIQQQDLKMSTNFSVLQGFGLFIKNDLGKREALSCQPGEIAEMRQTDGQTERRTVYNT